MTNCHTICKNVNKNNTMGYLKTIKLHNIVTVISGKLGRSFLQFKKVPRMTSTSRQTVG